MTDTKTMMNDLYNATGKTLTIKGERRRVISVRVCYGQALELKLDAPLAGCTSPLFTADPTTINSIQPEG